MADFLNEVYAGTNEKNSIITDRFNNVINNSQNENQSILQKRYGHIQQAVDERQENRERYQVDLPDEVYAELNKVISQAENPEEEAYKWGCAYKFAQAYNIPLQDAITNIDNYRNALWPDAKDQNYKSSFAAICDAMVLGNNSWKIGDLGNKIADAQLSGDEELVNAYMKQYQAIQQDNETRQDNIPRSWVVDALKTGAESAPFTAYTGAIGLFGNFIAPGVGTAAAFATSSYIAAGQEYLDLIDQGNSPEVARKVSVVSGVIQGAVEVTLGQVADLAVSGLKFAGKKITSDAVNKAVETVAKRFHYGPAQKVAVDYVMRYGKNILEEGAEEGLQELTSICTKEVAAALEDIEIDDATRAEYVTRIAESIKGGIIGAVVLGIPTTTVSTVATVKDYRQVQEAAQTIPNQKMFEQAVEKSPIFSEMNEETKKETMQKIWANHQQDRDEVWTGNAEEIAEVNKAHEGYEESVLDENGDEIVSDVYREENGRLFTDNVIQEDGKNGSYRVGDPTKSKNNLYGNIEYSIDESTNTVTINEFSLNSSREMLRAEVFDNFAQEFAGHKIEWETKGATATKLKEALIEDNPRGKQNGLSYYLDKNDSDIDTRRSIISQTLKAAPQIKKQDAAGLAMYMESIARHNGQSLSEYYKKVFGTDVNGNLNNMYGTQADGERIANMAGFSFEVGKEGYKTAGGITSKRFSKDLMSEYHSIIYVGQHGDFSTLVHEVTHASRHHFSDEILAQAEELVGVKDHNWTVEADEKLAKIVEDYFINNVSPIEPKEKRLIEKIADFFKSIFKGLQDTGVFEQNEKLTQDDKAKVFMDNLTSFTPEQFSEVIDSVNKVEQGINANNKVETDTTVQTEQQVNNDTSTDNFGITEEDLREFEEELFKGLEEQQKAEQQKAEVIDLRSEEFYNTSDPYILQLKEIVDKTLMEHDNYLLDPIKQVLIDPTASKEEKINALEQVEKINNDFSNTLFQIIREDSIKNAVINYRINDLVYKKLNDAKIMWTNYKNVLQYKDPKVIKGVIKRYTGWELSEGDIWVYETDSSYDYRKYLANNNYLAKKIPNMNKLEFLLNNSPNTLVRESNTGDGYQLRDIIYDSELYSIFPTLAKTQIRFIRDKKSGLFSINRDLSYSINLDLLGIEQKTPVGFNSVMAELTSTIISSIEHDNFKDIIDSVYFAKNYNELLRIAEDYQLKTKARAEYEEINKLYNTIQERFNKGIQDPFNMLAKIVGIRAVQGNPKNLLLEESKAFPVGKDLIDRTRSAVEHLNKLKDYDFFTNTEEQIIKDKYKNTDKWLKAPNGKPSKLKEQQWLEVRTQRFKDWFGDWENDPANASKILDENGEPKIINYTVAGNVNGTESRTWSGLDSLDKEQWKEKQKWDQFWAEQEINMFQAERHMLSTFNIDEQTQDKTIKMFLNIKNPVYKIGTIESASWAGLEAMDTAINMEHDGFMIKENGKIKQIACFYPDQIKSVGENLGQYDFRTRDNSVLFQELTEDQKARAYKFLDTFEEKEKTRILSNLNHEVIGKTGWATMALQCLSVRDDLQRLLNGEEIDENSLFNNPKATSKYKQIALSGKDAIYNYFDSDSSLIGGGGADSFKPLWAVAGSFLNCNPSPDCAKYCYAISGRSGMAGMIINRELVNWCIENDPVRAAEIVSRQYLRTGIIQREKLALRLLDTGDMSQGWVEFVKELNRRDIACSIFSKRPELLEQIDQNKNVIMLSLDKSNLEVGKKYPNLPKAWVLGEVVKDKDGIKRTLVTDADRQFLNENKETFLEKGGVILPISEKNRHITREELEKLTKDEKWIRNFTCPIDAGWKEIGGEARREKDNNCWNCSVCDKNGQGCSFLRSVKDRAKKHNVQFSTLEEIPQGVKNEVYKRTREALEGELRRQGLAEILIRSIVDTMGKELYATMAIDDRSGTARVDTTDSTGTTRESAEKLDIKAQELDAEYLQAVQSGDLAKAKAMVDAKMAEQVSIFSLLQDDQNEEGFKLYRGKEPKKIIKMYAVFNVSQDGFRAAYAGNKNPTPVGVWLSAQSLKSYVSDLLTFNDGTPKSYIIGDTGSPASNYFSDAKLKEYGLTKSAKMLLQRAGKHGVMDVPNFSQMNLGVDENGQPVKNKKADGALPHNKLIFEIECGIDENGDLSEYVKTNGRMEGSKNEGLAELEPNRFYQYKTNPNASGQWGLASTYRILRLVPYEEVVSKTKEANEKIRAENEEIQKRNIGKAKKDQEKLIKEIPLQKWVGGYKPEDSGLTVDSVNQMYKDGLSKKLQDAVTYDDYGNVIPLSERFNMKVEDARFQTLYHGSKTEFEKFNTNEYGYSGEGSMAFGYGTYLTDSQEIAKDYATRVVKRPYDAKLAELINSRYEKERYLKDRKKTFKSILDENKYRSRIEKNIREFEKDLKNDIKENDEHGIAFYEGLINDSKEQLKQEYRQNIISKFEEELKTLEQEIKDLNKEIKETEKASSVENNRHLYTVELEYSTYLEYDKKPTKTLINKILKQVQKDIDNKNEDLVTNYEYQNFFNDLSKNLYNMPSNEYVYNHIAGMYKDQKAASQFFNKIGFIGIKYPAGTLYGNGNGAHNYVIFNDEDIQIIEHLRFQTQEELYKDAVGYETWQDFMEAYTQDLEPKAYEDPFYHNQVPNDADAQWYQSTWEKAKGLVTEESLNQQEIEERLANEDLSESATDALFISDLQQNPTLLDDFLIRIAEIDSVDLSSDEWQHIDKEDAPLRERYELLQDYIGTQLTHGNWVYNAQRVRAGKELTGGARNRIIGLIRANPRQYRAIYSEIMESTDYAVDEKYSMANQLAGKLKRYKLVDPSEDIERINPERMKKLADEISNIEVASKIKNGTLKMGSELDNYLKSLNRQIREQEREYNELQKETYADYQRIADVEKRSLLRLNEKLLSAKLKLSKKNKEVESLINKGLKISDKYKKDAQNLRANYDEIFRKFKDLESVIQIDAQVQEALKRQEQVVQIKEDLNQKKNEKNAVAEIKRLRIQLVKRVMRRVPFDRIDYDNAKKLIAIQRVLEPNLLGGVNRWIGTESPVLREVISGVITDEDYKQELMKYLHTKRETKGLLEFIELLDNTKSIQQYNSWTKKQRAAAIRYLPKENWVRDLNLLKLAKEREESIDLDIDMVKVEQPMVDENGNVVINRATGDPYTQTKWVLNVAPEIEQTVKDIVGADMYNNMINRSFAEWTTEELETLAVMVNNLYKEGRDLLKAKREEQKLIAAKIRNSIEKTVRNTGISINDDDDDITRTKKEERINKILGLNGTGLKGTEAGKDKGFMARANRLLHSYHDANVRRVARILDNLAEGINTNELYWKENACYNAKEKSMRERAEMIQQVMKDNDIGLEDLTQTVVIENREYTIDELLYFLAASKDFAYNEQGKEDYSAPTSKNAVMFGNMFSAKEDLELRDTYNKLNDDMYRRIQDGELTQSEKELLALNQLDTQPGTTAYKNECIRRFDLVLAVAENLDEKYKALLDAIQDDYAKQYDRMNKVSIDEFNAPVHRVKAYVPLVRLESNGDTNINQVKEDLLATMGGQSKQYVNKGMTQRRTSQGPLHQKPVQTGLYKTWANSVERTEHFIAYAPYVRELNRVYKSRDAEMTRQFIESRYGKGMLKYVDDYINEVANPNANTVRTAGDELLRTLRGKTAPAYLAWKASAVIKQAATSPWPYMQFVNPAEYLAASWKCIVSRGKLYDVIRTKSQFMNKRVMDPMNDLIDEMADNAKTKFDKAIGKFNKKGMAGLEWIDWVCVAPGWLACYEKQYALLTKQNEEVYHATKQRLTEENDQIDFTSTMYKTEEQIETEARNAMIQDVEQAAIDYADDCTRLCQPSSRSVDIAPLFKNSSEAMKAYLQFQTSLNVIWQNLRYDIPYNVKNKMFFGVAGTIIGYTLAGIFMNSIMEGYSTDDDDDDENKALKEFIYYATTQFTDAVPMIGSDLTNTMDKVITGKSQFMSTGTDMTPTATKFINIFTNASKGNWEKAVELTAEGFAMGLGLPVSGAKEVKKLFNIGNKDEEIGLDLGNVYGVVDTIKGDKDE